MNPARSDNMIIQSICLLDQLDKDLNTFAMRVREWYCWHFPELRELVKDNYMFARCAAYIKVHMYTDARNFTRRLVFYLGVVLKYFGTTTSTTKSASCLYLIFLVSRMRMLYILQDRAAFDEDSLPGLNKIVMDEELAAAILKASRHSMGMDASPVDMSNIVTFCERMVKLAEYRRDLYAYLVDKVRRFRPGSSSDRVLMCLI